MNKYEKALLVANLLKQKYKDKSWFVDVEAFLEDIWVEPRNRRYIIYMYVKKAPSEIYLIRELQDHEVLVLEAT